MAADDRLQMRAENLSEGTELGPVFYLVSADQIARFAGAIGTGNSLYDGSDGAVAPPTMRLQDYALLIAQKFKGGSGGVHAKHWSEFHEPMRAGQAVKTTGKITRTYRKRGKFYFELEYESRDAVSDRLLVRQAITAILLREGAIK